MLFRSPAFGMSDMARELRRDGYRLGTLDLAATPAVPVRQAMDAELNTIVSTVTSMLSSKLATISSSNVKPLLISPDPPESELRPR